MAQATESVEAESAGLSDAEKTKRAEANRQAQEESTAIQHEMAEIVAMGTNKAYDTPYAHQCKAAVSALATMLGDMIPRKVRNSSPDAIVQEWNRSDPSANVEAILGIIRKLLAGKAACESKFQGSLPGGQSPAAFNGNVGLYLFPPTVKAERNGYADTFFATHQAILTANAKKMQAEKDQAAG